MPQNDTPRPRLMKTFEFRLRLNASQQAALDHILLDNCETYNAAIQERRDAWKLQRKHINYYHQQSELTELRKDKRFATIACDIQRDALRRVDRAFQAFFRRCKTGDGKPGYPRFRSRHRYDSFTFGGNAPKVRERSVWIPGIGDIRMRGGRPTEGKPRVVTVRRDGKRWTASVVCDLGPAPEKMAVSSAVGIDVGLTTLATLSDGTEIENPRWTHKHAARIAAANRRLARKLSRSKNRLRSKESLRRASQRAAAARLNHIHHASKWLVANYDLIAFEKLNIKGMVRSNFAKSILDASWAELIRQITYKAEYAGKWAIPVTARGTSIKCSSCGADVRKTLKERQHVCACGASLGRDHNAALNILALGHSAVVLQAEHRGNHA